MLGAGTKYALNCMELQPIAEPKAGDVNSSVSWEMRRLTRDQQVRPAKLIV